MRHGLDSRPGTLLKPLKRNFLSCAARGQLCNLNRCKSKGAKNFPHANSQMAHAWDPPSDSFRFRSWSFRFSVAFYAAVAYSIGGLLAQKLWHTIPAPCRRNWRKSHIPIRPFIRSWRFSYQIELDSGCHVSESIKGDQYLAR